MGNIVGYERLNKDTQVLEVVLEKVGGEYKLIPPALPPKCTKVTDLQFINVENYKDEKYLGEKVDIAPYKIETTEQKYLALKLSKMRRNVMFRYVPRKENQIIATMKIDYIVQKVERSKEVPKIYLDEQGHMDLEKLDNVEHFIKDVSIITATKNDREYSIKGIEKDLKDGLNKAVVKEAGNCEISLAVVTESMNM